MNHSTNQRPHWNAQTSELLQAAAYHFLQSKKLVFSRRVLGATRPATWKRILRAALLTLVCLNFLYFGFVAVVCGLYTITNPALSSLMITRALEGTAVKRVLFVPHKNIPSSTRSIFIELEDHAFYAHRGISLGAIKDAFLVNKQMGRTVSGGSTITQQLARNLFLNPDKNYVRKYLEAGTAVLMELILGKKRILELYLNYIEFGPGVFGIGQGALYQYKTWFENLSYEQRVRLAVIITSPLRYTVNTYYKRNSMKARYRAIMNPAPEEKSGEAPASDQIPAPSEGAKPEPTEIANDEIPAKKDQPDQLPTLEQQDAHIPDPEPDDEDL